MHQTGKNSIRGRFAPSPSGRLHLGNVLSALLAWLDVRSLGGMMVFRLEDLDPERSWDSYAEQMAEDLLWLGLDWDEGWHPGAGNAYRQGRRSVRYEAALDTLRARGMVYDCYCSRAERLAASAPHPGEHGDFGCRCRGLSPEEVRQKVKMGRRPALKLAVDGKTIAWTDGHYGAQRQTLVPGRDDFIIRRSDGVFAYQLAVSVDDMEMGINRVVRARDLLDSTPRQRWLIETLGGSAPDYCHAPLLVAPDGRKLSKREGDLNMEYFRARYTPEQLLGRLAKLAGLRETDAPVSAIELAADFSWDKVPRENLIIPNDI